MGEKEAYLGWGDVGWIALLIDFQSEGEAGGVLGASFKIHIHFVS